MGLRVDVLFPNPDISLGKEKYFFCIYWAITSRILKLFFFGL